METAVATVPDTFPALFWAYTAVWALFVVYFVGLGRKLSRIERSLSADKES